MDIYFLNEELQMICQHEREAKRMIGESGFRKLRSRLQDIKSSAKVTDLMAGRPHPLKGDRAGQFAMDLDGGRRLVFEPAQQPPPATKDGGIAWDQVTSVCIVFIGDYHD